MGRFLHIQIYNSAGTEVEYDNAIDSDWGIQAASAKLSEQIMDTELRFGRLYSTMFQVTLFNLNVDLRGRKIKVAIQYTTDSNYIIDGNGNQIVVSDIDRLIYTEEGDVTDYLFCGTIESSKKDRGGTYRDLIAYDKLYWTRDVNTADFWNSYWENRTTSTLAQLRNALLTYVGITAESCSLINDSITVENYFKDTPFSQLAFQDLLKMICELQNCCPHITTDDTIEFLTLGANHHDIRNKVEGQNSIWEDFTTEEITGVAVYDTGDSVLQVVGTDDNVYNIIGNIFLMNMSAANLETVATNILNDIQNITFVPGTFKLIISEPGWKLGDLIYTEYGIAYILHTEFSGSILIDETIMCKQINAYLNRDVEAYNDSVLEGLKLASVSKTIDAFTIDYADFKQQTQSTFEQTASTIVMKVDTAGNIVQVGLGVDPDDPTATLFEVSADNISFIANDTIELTSNNIAINSTNFVVTKEGEITANKGSIGGWTITDKKIYGGDGTTGVAVMQRPTSTTQWVFAAGGTSHDDYSDCKFRVDKAGSMYSTSGTIGGWTISTGKISGGDSTTGVAVMQMPSSSITWVFGAGGTSHTSYSNCKFKVSKAGAAYSTGINITEGTSTGDNALAYIAITSSGYGGVRVRNSGSAYAAMYGNGNIYASGTKSRTVQTKDYGEKLLYCYETPTPLFGDVGEGKIAEDGKCYVWLDPVFAQTISEVSYQVFLQKYGDGKCYISERAINYFIVEGDVGLEFGWELKAKQRGFEHKRLDTTEWQLNDVTTQDYGKLAVEHLQIIQGEREVS